MSIALIGVGRLGRVLAQRFLTQDCLYLYDRNEKKLQEAVADLGGIAAASLSQAAQQGTLVLAVPDQEVIQCIKALNHLPYPVQVVQLATTVSQKAVESVQATHVRCISAKVIGHAQEMELGQTPIIILEEQPSDLAEMAKALLAPVGKVMLGNSDRVQEINTLVVQKILEAAVAIEEAMAEQTAVDPVLLSTALRQVGVGVLKGYAEHNLGPFAQAIVERVRRAR